MWLLDIFEFVLKLVHTVNSMFPLLLFFLKDNLVHSEDSNSSDGPNDNTKVSYGGTKKDGQALLQWFTTFL